MNTGSGRLSGAPASAPESTRYFSAVLGVFQGGGVRGSALAGAFAAARERGVRFSAVAGTSAGSIIAALIAAGASPTFVLDQLTKVKFADLLAEPVKSQRAFTASWAARNLLGPFLPEKYEQMLKYSGMFSANLLEEWINDMLCAATGLRRVVTFEDLKIPLFVVAANVRSRKVVVWNSVSNPTMSVARAARRSASIPFFFQPDIDRDGIYVDGGSLSNLPAFVYADPQARAQIGTPVPKVLAFRLRGESGSAMCQTPEDFLEALIDTHVEGNIDLQLKLQDDVHTIEIPTGLVRATDFGTITKEQTETLWKSGAAATRAFLQGEAEHVRIVTRRRFSGLEEEMYLFTSIAAERTHSSVTVVGETTFVFYTMPTLLLAEEDGLALHVYARTVKEPEPYGTEGAVRQYRDEMQRRSILQGLGATLHEYQWLPWQGFVFRDEDRRVRKAIVVSDESSDIQGSNFATRPAVLYSDPIDSAIIDLLERELEFIENGQPPNAAAASDQLTQPTVTYAKRPPLQRLPQRTSAEHQLPALEWEVCPEDAWQSLLRRVRLYSDEREVTLSLIDVPLIDLCVIDKYVKEYRLPSVRRLIRAYHDSGRRTFDPYFVRLQNGHRTLVTPPVIERTADGHLVVMEGVTRCFYLAMEGAHESVRAIVVNGVKVRLPGGKGLLRNLRTTSRTLAIEENISDFMPEYLRRIEYDVHPFPSPYDDQRNGLGRVLDHKLG